MTARDDGARLEDAVRVRGFSPKKRELEPLLLMLASLDRDDDELVEAIERAVVQLGVPAGQGALARLVDAAPPLRGRLCKIVGKVAQQSGDEALIAALLERVGDRDGRTERVAIAALGRIGGARAETRLITRWGEDVSSETRRTLATALGKIGGPRARAAIAQAAPTGHGGDGQLTRIVSEATLKIERTVARDVGSVAIEPSRETKTPLRVWLHCRSGLAPLVVDELGETATRIDATRVEATLVGRLDSLFRSRIALRFGFPLEAPPLVDRVDERARVEWLVATLRQPAAREIVTTFTRATGRIPYRLEWVDEGHRRALTFAAANAIDAAIPEWRNDPTASAWEIVVRASGTDVPSIELSPRGLDDPRFAYRRRDVPASSHPTIAAALVRVAGVRNNDVVWDPFVGAAAELIERARAGAYSSMMGSDLSEPALDAADANLRAARVDRVNLRRADACAWAPDRAPSLIITNPPMGRRVLDRGAVAEMLPRFVQHAGELLAPSGRMVWASPRPELTARAADAAGLTVVRSIRVDMGGFDAVIQRLERRPGSTQRR